MLRIAGVPGPATSFKSIRMKSTLRNVLALVVAFWLAIPTTSSDTLGGENNSGTGVWILPCCAQVNNLTGGVGSGAPRMEITIAGLTGDIGLRVSDQCGAVAATFIDDISGLPVSLPVAGRVVVLKESLLRALAQSAAHNVIAKASIVVTDALQRGYVLRIAAHAGGRFVLQVD